jgi:hypothetical protein
MRWRLYHHGITPSVLEKVPVGVPEQVTHSERGGVAGLHGCLLAETTKQRKAGLERVQPFYAFRQGLRAI